VSDPKDPDQYRPLEKHDCAAAVAANAATDRAGFWSISLVLIRGYSSAKHALCRPGYDGSSRSKLHTHEDTTSASQIFR